MSQKSKRNFLNSYLSKIFIINLKDKTERLKKTTKQFKKQGIKYSVFEAIDGRCSGKKECNAKKRSLEKEHHIKIKMDSIPAASLIIGTIKILREQVRNKWPRIMICEDDIELTRNVADSFKKGLNEIKGTKYENYDILYLGCGNKCGVKGISSKRTSVNKHLTSLSIVKGRGYNWFVRHKNDIRMPCDDCKIVTKSITIPSSPYGGWAYIYTLKAAKKLLKYINNAPYDAIDMIIPDAIEDGIIKPLAFDPPIIMHEEGAVRSDSTIDWEW